MIRNVTFMALLLAPALLFRTAGAADTQGPATSLIPDNAVLVVNVSQPKALIDRAFDESLVKFVQSLPPYQEAMARPETQQAVSLVKFFENKYSADLRTLLSKLVGGGMTLAVGPNDSILLIVDAEDGQILQDVHDFFRTIARTEAAKQGDAERVKSEEYRGVTGWTFGPNEVHAIVGNRLIVSNKSEGLKGALDLHAEPSGKTISKSAKYQSALKAIDAESKITVFADMSVLRQLPGVEQALAQGGNPMGRLLFAPLAAAVSDATWAAAGIDIDADTLTLSVVTDCGSKAPTTLNSFSLPPTAEDGAMPNLVVPRQIAAMSLYRDLHKFYASKDELFPERTSGLIFFENMMGIFFSGRDLTEEILGGTLPDIRLVVAEQEYNEKTGEPSLRLPGFALVFRLHDPVKSSLVMRAGWQNAIGLINTTSGQKAQPTLLFDTDVYNDTKYYTSFFLFPNEADRKAGDMRLNFRPSLVTLGDHVILSSSDLLARDLIDALKRETEQGVTPLAGKHSLVTLKSAPLASILDANREAMIRQNMVEDGKSRAEAENEVQGILTVLKYLNDLSVAAGTEEGLSRLTVKLGYDFP